MAEGLVARFASRAALKDGAGGSMRLLTLAWVLLACAALMVLVPARYTARATLSFDVAAQPAPATVRGIAQMLTSREMAFEVLDHLPRSDATWLAIRRGSMPTWLSTDERSARDRAASRLNADVTVTPLHGGRTLEIAFTADRPELASQVAQAYSDTFTALQTSARMRTPDTAETALPQLSVGMPLQIPTVRDLPPVPAMLGLLGIALALGILTLHLRRQSAAPVRTPRHDLPRLDAAARRVAWMDAGRGAGLTCDEAIHRLSGQLASQRGRPEAQLIVLTSEAPSDTSATCAIGLARQLSEDSRVALVALDGASPELRALVADSWAPGIGEMLFGVAGFGETIHRDTQSRAHIIPPGRDARSEPGIVGAERLPLILNSLRQTYEFVIVSAPVLGWAASADKLAALSPYVICVEEAAGGPTSVEAYDALAAHGFGHVLMLRIDAGRGIAALGDEDVALRLTPSLSAA